jgi:predicted acyl esterase
VVPVDVALGPSATLFKAGETLRLVIAGRWLWPHNLLTRQYPAATSQARRADAPSTGDSNAEPTSSSPPSLELDLHLKP